MIYLINVALVMIVGALTARIFYLNKVWQKREAAAYKDGRRNGIDAIPIGELTARISCPDCDAKRSPIGEIEKQENRIH